MDALSVRGIGWLRHRSTPSMRGTARHQKAECPVLDAGAWAYTVGKPAVALATKCERGGVAPLRAPVVGLGLIATQLPRCIRQRDPDGKVVERLCVESADSTPYKLVSVESE